MSCVRHHANETVEPCITRCCFFLVLFQVEGLRDQLLRATRAAGEVAEDQKRLQRELASAAGAVEDRTRLQQRFVLFLRVRALERKSRREAGEAVYVPFTGPIPKWC